ncbi:MAG: response regulator transcription factor [Sphingomonadales bacterium]|jgi:DNA-binding NarL/FixJ family response regulator
MKLLIADDHDLLRDVLGAYLAAENGMEAVLVADQPAALKAMAQDRFDLVLLDYAMPGMNGLTGLEQALAAAQGAPVALMSGNVAADLADRALAMGAAGFVPKTLPAKSMLNAIRFMASGEIYLPLSLARTPEPAPPGPADALTPRERQVLKGLCAGHANKEIARDLGLSEPTIKLHVKLLCRKLDARNRTHAAMIAKEGGFC